MSEELTPEQIEEMEILCFKHGLKDSIVTEISRYQLLVCLFHHCQNRDEWHDEAIRLRIILRKIVSEGIDTSTDSGMNVIKEALK